MIPVITVPNVQFQPTPVQTELVVGVPTQVSPLSRLAHYAVPSTFTAPQLYNNTRGGSSYAPSRAQLAASQAQSNPPNLPAFQLPTGAALGASLNFTSQFMAQVMGQGGAANDNGLIAAFYQSAQRATPQQDATQPYSLNYLLGAANKAGASPTPKHIGAELITTSSYQSPETKGRNAIDSYGASFARNRVFLEEKDRVVNAITL